jgi:hypothetical protein
VVILRKTISENSCKNLSVINNSIRNYRQFKLFLLFDMISPSYILSGINSHLIIKDTHLITY